MQVRFLLGPAGSGKTFRCLAEIRAALARSPADTSLPLVLIAPKQATFQVERQLLGGGTVAGYTRLHVLSFDRLAEFIFDRLHIASPRLLSAEGRLMVLRALLRRHDGELKLLRGSARRVGFAQEVGGQLAELQQNHFGPARLRALAANKALRPDLCDKLHDLALLQEKYTGWLDDHGLQDNNCLLDFATGALRAIPDPHKSPLAVQHLWLDGFAEMTPQEHALLAAIMPFCGGATLAFCLETEPTPAQSWLSIWSAIGKTFQRCRAQLAAVPGCEVRLEILRRTPGKNRFAENSELAALEEGWALPRVADIDASNLKPQISVIACPNPEAEAVYAARELLKFIRTGNRFRDCAVLVRNLEDYHQPLAQIFRRYEIPFFLDRRESVAHHPLAELTRNAIRTIAGDWQHDDWFAAVKAGFTPLADMEIDRLENLALESGWRGKKWLEPLPDEDAERLRLQILLPFEKLHRRLKQQRFEPTGVQLADAIRELWGALHVESTLDQWSTPENDVPSVATRHPSLHETVFEQMTSWLDNVAMAFPRETMPLRDWLPVLEAGLAGLTVGVIPPTLDEVLVGAIDRARNPDLKFALLLGVNESVFPAALGAPVILTNSDRNDLEKQNAALGLDLLNQISRERYLGYIACTRANQRLALTFARQDAARRVSSPSPFITHLQARFPRLEIEEFSGEPDWREAEQVSELVQPMVELQKMSQSLLALAPAGKNWVALMKLPAVKSLSEKLGQLREPDKQENLAPELAEKIYGPVLKSSVSRLEEFAQCPFRFFVHSGLRAEERKKFELDARERGTFQHEILKELHDELMLENKRWRDISPAEARTRVGEIAARLAQDYRAGLLREDHQSQFTARALTMALQDFVETLVVWMRGQYDFDPAKAETGFGLGEELPAWTIDLGHGHALALRGRVDRVDIWRNQDRALAVVMDYKSSSRKLDNVLVANGIQLQLLAYLAAVRQWPAKFFGVEQIVPAGVFYVNLRGQFESGGSRAEVLKDVELARRKAYRHWGRFDVAALDKLDRLHTGEQFNYQLNKDGTVRSNSAEAISGEDFIALLDQVEERLQTLGREIYSGAARVDPYRKGSVTACDYCDYRAVCRIDAMTHEFRDLRATKTKEDEN